MRLAFYGKTLFVIVEWLLALAWTYQSISAASGMRKLPTLLDGDPSTRPSGEASVVVVVPACNEEQAVGACVESLIKQDWPHLHIIAVDDRSTDATGRILDELAVAAGTRLSVLHVTSLPEGWLGKTHAMALAARHAKSLHHPRWLLFTDADVLFHPECLRRSLALAETQQADHLVTAPTAVIRSHGEAILMAFLQVIGLWGARLWRVADQRSKDAVGIGAFALLRTSVYDHLGGFDELRLQVLEDLAMARRVKNAGFRQRIVLAPQYVRIHWAAGLGGVLHTMTKNLFAIFGFRVSSMLTACCGLSVLCLGPYAGFFWSPTRLPSCIALVAIASIYATANRYLSPVSVMNFFAFPVSAVLFLYAILRSTIVTLRDGGVRWRGTLYPIAQLRREAFKLR